MVRAGEALMPVPARASLLLAPTLLLWMSFAHAVDVWTVGMDNTRQGWNKSETVLTPANVPRLKKLREFSVLPPLLDLPVIAREEDVGHAPAAEIGGPRVMRVFEAALELGREALDEP